MDAQSTRLQFGRRATDDAFKAFHHACEAGDLQGASDLLLLLEEKFNLHLEKGEVEGERLRNLLQAQARLWSLRCRSFGDVADAAADLMSTETTEFPATTKLRRWLGAWLRGPRDRFAAAAEFSIKGP